MIKITIEREVAFSEKQNMVTNETPTAQRSKYDEALMARDYAIVDVVKTRTERILTQEISDESKFDLTAVIKAINGI